MKREENIVSYTMQEIIERNERGEYVPTPPDAPTYELDDDFWKNARVVMPDASGKEAVTVRYDRDVLSWFKSTGKGWQTRMNAVLRSYVSSQQENRP